MHDNRNGIQADKPVPPWERPGCFRMDCDPHRAPLLRVMGIASVVGGLSGFLPLLFIFAGSPYGILGALFLCLVVSPLISLATRFMARSDLAKMEKGLIDPSGEEQTVKALADSKTGLGLNLGSIIGWVAVILIGAILAALMRV